MSDIAMALAGQKPPTVRPMNTLDRLLIGGLIVVGLVLILIVAAAMIDNKIKYENAQADILKQCPLVAEQNRLLMSRICPMEYSSYNSTYGGYVLVDN